MIIFNIYDIFSKIQVPPLLRQRHNATLGLL